jgi:hypothetical protein
MFEMTEPRPQLFGAPIRKESQRTAIFSEGNFALPDPRRIVLKTETGGSLIFSFPSACASPMAHEVKLLLREKS